MLEEPHESISYFLYQSGTWTQRNSKVVVEMPVTLTVNGDQWLTLICTPIELDALMIGFLFNEGYINSMEEVASVRICQSGNNVDIWLKHSLDKPVNWKRTSGCTGGITSVEMSSFKTHSTRGKEFNAHLSPTQVCQITDLLYSSQDLYNQTGGIHTSILTNGKKTVIAAEDIGRHNTLDKIAGRYLMESTHINPKIILTTGRISSEMLQKSSRLNASIVISRTSPSSLSIEMAKILGITLIGYARRNQFKVFSHPARITFAEKLPSKDGLAEQNFIPTPK